MIIALDVGGTHTDIVLLGKTGLVKKAKVLTDQEDIFGTVLSSLEKITEGIDISQIKRIVLSTTLTTNALVQNRTNKVALIALSGPGLNPYDLDICPDFFVAKGSIDHRGNIIEDIDEEEIQKISEEIKKRNISYLGIVAKFGGRNPSLEMKVFHLLKNKFEKVFLGHRIAGRLNFPRRLSTVYLNAAVFSIHNFFLGSILHSLKEKGLNVPIDLLKADGGTMNFEASLNHPAQTILSGPAASAMGTIAFCEGTEDVISLDIGGTTTDLAILINKSPILEPVGITIGKYKTLIRALKTYSIGIGGDSFVQVLNGSLKIGPERLGRAMAFGGEKPTLVDALCVLKEIKVGDYEKAKLGISLIAKELNLSLEETSLKIVDSAVKSVLNAIDEMIKDINSKPVYTISEFLENYRVKPKKILLLGAPAEVFAKYINKLSSYEAKAVHHYEVANAIGTGLAKTTCDITILVDTEKEVFLVPEEGIVEKIGYGYSLEKALLKAEELLKAKTLKRGGNLEDFEMDIIDKSQFNIVRNFCKVGKNIRIKVQVKPGFIGMYKKSEFSLLKSL